jgi:hypothetical protein
VGLAQGLIMAALGVPTKTPLSLFLPLWRVIRGLPFGYTPNYSPGHPNLGPRPRAAGGAVQKVGKSSDEGATPNHPQTVPIRGQGPGSMSGRSASQD